MFPVNPNVFEREPAGEALPVQRPQGAMKSDGVFLEAALQAPFAGAARVKMGGLGSERFNARIGNTDSGKMRIIERKAEVRHKRRKRERALRGVSQRAEVRFHGHSKFHCSGLFDAP